jgi:AAA15 family ATPase/GTPase
MINFEQITGMEPNHLESFEVSGFKRFNHLKVDNIGQFNLIIGDNNVGKTSLLEGFFANPRYGRFIDSLASINHHIRNFKNPTDHFLRDFFNNSTPGSPQNMDFLLTEVSGDFENIRIRKTENDNIIIVNPIKNKLLTAGETSGVSLSFSFNINSFAISIPFVGFSQLYSHDLTSIYSDNFQGVVDKKERLLSALSTMIPEIKNIEISISHSTSPILKIEETGKNRLIPLAFYGDGTLKLLRILFSLLSENQDYNRLMIDELDSGIHYSKLTEFIKSLVSVSCKEKKQIFATTHSKECIESFTNALRETGMESEGRIIKLADTKKGIKAYTMLFEEFENAVLAESEMR